MKKTQSKQSGSPKATKGRRTQKGSSQQPTRITNQTVAEHRERVIAEGRRFKYPVQYARHRVVTIATIVVIVAVIVFVSVVAWMLYGGQNTSRFALKITETIPVPVAKVDTANVRYSDYLNYYRMSAHYLKSNEQFDEVTRDGQAQAAYLKRQSLDLAIENAYARHLAKENSIEVSDDELAAAIKQDKKTADGVVSDDTYQRSALLFYDMDVQDFQKIMHDGLLRRKVRFYVDTPAKKAVDAMEKRVKSGEKSVKKLAEVADTDLEASTGSSGRTDSRKSPDPIIQELTGKKAGGVYGPYQMRLEDREGFYFIKLKSVDGAYVEYEYVVVPLKEFTKQLDALKEDGKVTEYITVDKPKEE